jgi:hypothetical protein
VGTPSCSNQFVKFDLNSFCVTILGVLNQKNHQEGDDGRSGIDNKLPGIAEVKDWSGYDPNDDDGNCHCEHPWAATEMSDGFGEARVPSAVVHAASLVSWFNVLLEGEGSWIQICC